jgi:hypothetical protein
MASEISDGLQDYMSWPDGFGIPRRGDIVSLLLRVKKAGYWMPPDEIFDRRLGGRFLSNYLHGLGTLLRDEHFNEAKELSQSGEQEFQTLQF